MLAEVGPLGWEIAQKMSKVPVRRWSLVPLMAATVAAIAGTAYWDAQRESAAALKDFTQEQTTLARAIGATLKIGAGGAVSIAEDEILRGLHQVERPRALTILVHWPGEAVLRATDGRTVEAARLIDAMRRGEASLRIPRDEAGLLGLPPRTAIAGLSRIKGGGAGLLDIAAVATAERERDRGTWGRRRSLLSVLTAASLVLALGGIAMRTQRKELVLERQLAVTSLRQQRDERLQRASRAAAMGTLAMGVAHEISTPLGVIAARAEQMMPKVAADQRLAAGVSAILAQTDRINQVVRGLLGLARGDAPSSERIDPRAIVAAAVGLVEHRFAKGGVPLKWESHAGVPMVIGDPRLLEHGVVNLLLNACDACRGSGAVEVILRLEGGQVEIIVQDSGTGISPADVGRALEPFFTTKAREGGTGLGLAIAHEIVASHRGSLTFSAVIPRGTRAVIRLPRAEEAIDA